MRFRVYQLPSGLCWFGHRQKLYDVRLKVFAFVTLHTGEMSVLEYEDTPDGYEDLASLLRTGEVIAVVKGEKLNFAVESVVSLPRDGELFESRLPINRGF